PHLRGVPTGQGDKRRAPRGHRSRPRPLQEPDRAARRPHLGRVRAGPRLHLHLHPARGGEGVKARLSTVLTSLTAKYVAVFVLLVAVPAVAVGVYTLSSSYNREKADLIRLQQEKAKSVADSVDRTFAGIAARLSSFHLAGASQSKIDTILGSLPL